MLGLSPSDGRIVLSFPKEDGNKLTSASIEYLCLNPAVHLNRIMDQVNKLLLTSGTLEPAGEFALLKSKDAGDGDGSPWRFNCGHVVGKANFKALCVGSTFDFRYEHRNNQSQLRKLALFTENVIRLQQKTLGGGSVLFLQSYAYQRTFKSFVEDHSDQCPLLSDINFTFWESQTTKNIFESYSRRINKERKGAALICVIGGKLSEGINFSDDLARTVMVAGLPYPST